MKEYLDKGKLEILKKEIGKLINEDKIDLTEEDLRKISGGIKNVSAKLTSSVLAALTGTGFFINNTFAQSDLPENMPVLNRQNVKTNNIKNEDSKPKQKSEKSGNLKKVAASAASVGIPVGVFATILYKALHSEKNHPKFGVIGSRELCEQFINRLPGDKVQTGLKYSRSEISGIRVEIDSTFVGQTGRNGVVHVTPGHFTLDFDFINISPSDYNVSTTDESIIKFIEEHDVICPLIDLSGINAQMSLSDIHNHIKRLVTPLTIFLHTIDLYKYNEFIGVNWDPNVRDIRNTFVDTVGAGLEQNILKKFREQKTSAPYMTQTISGHSLPAGHDPYSNYDDFLYAYDLQLSQASRLAMGVRGQYVQ